MGKPEGKEIVREFGMDMYTLLYLKWITNKDLLQSTWNSVQMLCGSLDGRGVGGEWIHVYVQLSPFADSLPETIASLLIGYTPVQNKKLIKKEMNKKGYLIV